MTFCYFAARCGKPQHCEGCLGRFRPAARHPANATKTKKLVAQGERAALQSHAQGYAASSLSLALHGGTQRHHESHRDSRHYSATKSPCSTAEAAFANTAREATSRNSTELYKWTPIIRSRTPEQKANAKQGEQRIAAPGRMSQHKIRRRNEKHSATQSLHLNKHTAMKQSRIPQYDATSK